MDTQQMILDEVRGLRKEVQDHFKNYENRITAVETKVEPLVEDAKFKSRVQLLTHALTGAIGAGIVMAVRMIWPAHVPPPSILGKYLTMGSSSSYIECTKPLRSDQAKDTRACHHTGKL